MKNNFLVIFFFFFVYSNAQNNNNSIDAITYILSEKELNEYNMLDTYTSKIAFIDQFWKNFLIAQHDTSNKYRIEFESRVEKADLNYTVGTIPGWQTDRGRIFIIYGEPDEISFEMNKDKILTPPDYYSKKDMIVWYYDTPKGSNEIPESLNDYNTGRMFFVFAREVDSEQYLQIFSTEKGEKIDSELYFRRLPVIR